MDKGYKIRNPQGIYFLTFTVVEWVDVFTRREYADIVIDSLKHCQQEKGLILYGWCLMHNHLHLVASAKNGISLSDILRDFKKFTSKQVIKSIEENPKWSSSNEVTDFSSHKEFEVILRNTPNSGGKDRI